ncbi:hypothetical protein CMV_026397, partial [Castanea mollissima]
IQTFFGLNLFDTIASGGGTWFFSVATSRVRFSVHNSQSKEQSPLGVSAKGTFNEI